MKSKNKYMAFASITVLSVTAAAFVCLSNGNNQSLKNTIETKAASGPTQASSVPTTNIDLKDSTDSEIRSYYSSLNSISDTNEKRGTNLLKNLRTIIHNFEYFTYAQVWQIYEITDREWELSPAASNSSLGITYDSSSKIFTKYTYGTSTSSPGSNPYVHTLYRNRDSNGVTTQYARIREWDAHTSSTYAENTMHSGMTNREHVWCQSRGFKHDPVTGPAGTDIHHLISGDGYVNQTPHNDNPYGYVKTVEVDASSKVSWLSGNLKGAPKTTSSLDKATVVFEPQDSDKGDIARACFYMAACYNNYSGNENITNYDPNLVMADYATDNGTSVYSSSTSPVGMGILSDLLEWHKLDPVDEYEIHRNNLIYKNYQKNRNPFIDFPEWVDYIWGNKSGYAKPNSDTINGYNDGSSTVVAVTGVSVTPDTVSVAEGSTAQLTATISPSNATNQGITWTSDSANATVDNSGVVTGVSAGTATITATTSDGGFTDTCTVTITESQGGGGGEETPTTGNATMAAGTNGSSCTVNDTDGIKVGTSKSGGDMTITVPAGTTSLSFYAAAWKGVTGLSINISGATVSPASVSLTADDGISNGSPFTLTGSEEDYLFTITLSNITEETTLTLTSSSAKRFVVWGAKYTINSSTTTPTLSSITLDTSNVQTEFYVGSTFNYDNLVVTANYDDESSKTVTPSNVSSPDMSTAGNKTITVTYAEGEVSKTATYTITVSAAPTTTYSVTYNANGATSGSVPTDNNSYASGATVTVKGNTGSLAKTNYTFAGWNTSSDGTGTTYASGNTFTITSNTTLYAKWTAQSASTATWTHTFKSGELSTSAQDVTLEDDIDSSDTIVWAQTTTTYVGFDGTYGRGVQIGKGDSPTTSFTLSTSGFDTKITNIVVNSAIASSGVTSFTVSVGNTQYGEAVSPTTSATDYSFSGNSSGSISIAYDNTNGTKAFYIKSIEVTYEIDSSQPISVTGVTLDKNSLQLLIGKQGTLTANVLPTKATNKNVTWSSSDNNVATVNEGVVTGVAAGTATITVTTVDGGFTASCSVNVSTSKSFKLVSSINELISGTKVIIAATSSDVHYAACAYSSGNNLSSVTATLSDNYLIPNPNFEEFTIGYSESGYTFKQSDGKYLYAAGGTSEKNNYLKAQDTLVSASYFNITIENGEFSIVCADTTVVKNTMRFNARSDQLKFACYSSGQTAIQLYADVEAGTQAFVDNFMHMSDYNSELGYCKDSEHHYFSTAKTQLLAMGADYISEFQNNDLFNNAQRRYENWASANGQDPYNVTNTSSINVLLSVASKDSTTLIIVLSAAILSSIGFVMFYRKKRKQ